MNIENDIQMKKTKKLYEQHNRLDKNVQNKVVAEQEKWKTDSFQIKKYTHHLLANQTTPMARTVKTTTKPKQIYERCIVIYLKIIWMKEII